MSQLELRSPSSSDRPKPKRTLFEVIAITEGFDVLSDIRLAHDNLFVKKMSKKYNKPGSEIRLALVQVNNLLPVMERIVQNESRGFIATIIEQPTQIVRGGVPAILLMQNRYCLSVPESIVVRQLIKKSRKRPGVPAHR